MRTFRGRLLGAAVIVPVLLSAAACGGDDDKKDAAAPSAAPSPVAATNTAPPVPKLLAVDKLQAALLTDAEAKAVAPDLTVVSTGRKAGGEPITELGTPCDPLRILAAVASSSTYADVMARTTAMRVRDAGTEVTGITLITPQSAGTGEKLVADALRAFGPCQAEKDGVIKAAKLDYPALGDETLAFSLSSAQTGESSMVVARVGDNLAMFSALKGMPEQGVVVKQVEKLKAAATQG